MKKLLDLFPRRTTLASSILLLSIVLISPTLFCSASAQQTSVQESHSQDEAKNSEFDLELQLKSYDKVWETIKNAHWDPEKVGDKWTAARDKYRPLVEEAKSIDDVRVAMEKLIGTLGQSHFGVIPSDSYEEVEEDGDQGDADSGITFRLMEDGVGVAKIRRGSPAEKQGVKVGWMLTSIGDKSVVDVLPKLKKAVKGPVRLDFLVGRVFTRRAGGKLGSKKEFVFFDESGKSINKTLEMEEPPGTFTQFGNLPKMRVDFETQTLEGGIGYFRFSSFFDPMRVMPAYAKAVRNEEHQKGFIIDLRGNPGGMAGMTMGMARPLVEETVELGTMNMKGNELKFNAVAQPNPYQGKVVVLIDECSASCSEILSGGLQDLGIAHVIGSRTAGLALPSIVVKLPNGDGLQHAMADYHSKSGKSLEMDGVSPDEEVVLSAKLLQIDPDPAMSRAIQWINSEN